MTLAGGVVGQIGYDTGEVLRRHRNLHIVVFTLDPNHPSVKETYKERKFFIYTPIFTANREAIETILT